MHWAWFVKVERSVLDDILAPPRETPICKPVRHRRPRGEWRIGSLPTAAEREKRIAGVLKLRADGLSMRAVAKALNCTPERVRQIEAKTLRANMKRQRSASFDFALAKYAISELDKMGRLEEALVAIGA